MLSPCDITNELISMNTLYACIIGGRGGFTPRGRGRGGGGGRGFGSGRGKQEIHVLCERICLVIYGECSIVDVKGM